MFHFRVGHLTRTKSENLWKSLKMGFQVEKSRRFLLMYGLIGISGLWGCTEPLPKSIGGQDQNPQLQNLPNQNDAYLSDNEGVCRPQCTPSEQRCGQDDGCGDVCPPCVEDPQGGREGGSIGMSSEGGTTNGGMNHGGQSNLECTSTCASEGAQCGEVCGQSCGQCSNAQERCQEGQCVCTPHCNGVQCGGDDGCGGTCSPCPRMRNCESCILRLEVDNITEITPTSHSVRLKVSVNFPPQAPQPEMADLRLQIQGPALFGRVGLGSVLMNSQKGLIPDPATGLPYRVFDQNQYAFTILSTQNTTPIPNGDWLWIELMVGDTSHESVRISIQKREQTFAPPTVDLVALGDQFEESVVIWPALRGEE